MSTKYTYSIASDTANGVVNSSVLINEIDADPGITTELDGYRVDTSNDVLDIYFVTALSGSEVTALNAVVLAHQGVATSPVWQKWEDGGSQGTTSENWTTAMQRTAMAVSGGTYRISWNYELRIVATGAVNSKAASRVKVDGSIKGFFFAADEEWIGYSGWDFKKFTAGETPQILIEFRRDPTVGGNDTIEIKRVKISIELMPE